MGQLLARLGVLRKICYFAYEGLPLAIVIVFAMTRSGRNMTRSGRRRQTSRTLAAFMVTAAGGFLAYNLYSAVGPVHIFGPRFPYAPPHAGLPPFAPFATLAEPSAARNAMPSVHMALLIFWHARTFGRTCRVLAGALLELTVMATLEFGEHYLVDLFVAVPFALAAQGLAASGVPWRHPARIASVAAGALSVVGWLIYLRLPAPLLGTSGLSAWSCSSAPQRHRFGSNPAYSGSPRALSLTNGSMRKPSACRDNECCVPPDLPDRSECLPLDGVQPVRTYHRL
ncbi:MAG TPA: phosphatase PAP2 family protein [Bryobacteraceae bacterium]|jgi:hypothetical protein|nr:phosphatase PAP2 family protein [Bryobacteraceae bacterium]